MTLENKMKIFYSKKFNDLCVLKLIEVDNDVTQLTLSFICGKDQMTNYYNNEWDMTTDDLVYIGEL